MNWLHFLLWVGGLYLLYYLVVILLDVAGAKRAPAGNSLTQELTFSESVLPTQLKHDGAELGPGGYKPGPNGTAKLKNEDTEIIGSGGVAINNLFALAKQEAIIYTRSVSF